MFWDYLFVFTNLPQQRHFSLPTAAHCPYFVDFQFFQLIEKRSFQEKKPQSWSNLSADPPTSSSSACIRPLPAEVPFLSFHTALFRHLSSWSPYHGGSPPARRGHAAVRAPLPSVTISSCRTILLLPFQKINHYSEILQNCDVTPVTFLHLLISSPPSLRLFSSLQIEPTVPSSLCQHQLEIWVALEKGKGNGGGRREERVVMAADAEHRHCHLICISQWFVPLPVALPVLGWGSPLTQCPGHWGCQALWWKRSRV